MPSTSIKGQRMRPMWYQAHGVGEGLGDAFTVFGETPGCVEVWVDS